MSNPLYSSIPTIIPIGTSGAGYVTAGGGGAGGGGFNSGVNYKLTAERLEEWQWFQNFMEQNPDIKERFAVHKTYEILKDDDGTR